MHAIRLLTIVAAALSAAACGKAGVTSDSSPVRQGGEFRMGVLGDSISRGFDTVSLGAESLDWVWATGSTLGKSHFNRMRSHFADRVIMAQNLAKTGDRVLGSGSEFLQRAKQMAGWNPDYVTILIGANDVCQGNLAGAGAADRFRAQVSLALNALLNSAHPPKLIAVASIPRIWALTQNPDLAANGTCQLVWNSNCSQLSAGQARFEAEWSAANQALQLAAVQAGARVIFDDYAVANTAFSTSDIAFDCFHPSTAGQGKIADAIWTRVAGHLNQLSAP